MCGIAGKIKLDSTPILQQDIKLMLEKINHRGPDDEGIFIDKYIGLGHKRLSIIDLSPLGHQPMKSEDGKIVITFNGEIYNYKALRNELQSHGYKFKSQTDTEVIIYLYDKYGYEALKKLRGMFSFVIYDKKKNIVWGARDRLGVKPLKYYLDNNNFIFASELKAILVNSEVKKEIDYQAIYDYLSFSYVPHPRTGFKNIYKLPQAHYFILNLDNNKFEIKRYWDLDFNNKLAFHPKDLKNIFLEKIEESVKLRMISDVPLGVFLSGGIDSSLVAHYMAMNSNKPIKTFSIRSEVPKYDEGKYIKLIVDKYQTEHHELYLKPSSFSDLEKIVEYYEEPFGDSSMLPLYNLSEYASQHITVSLCGEGGDEDFGGYSYYIKQKYLNLIQKYPKFLRKFCTKLNNLYFNNILKTNFLALDDKFISQLSNDSESAFFNFRAYLNKEQKSNYLKQEFIDKVLENSNNFYNRIIKDKFFEHELDKIFYIDYYSFIPDDLMTKLDIASMAHGIEGRVPLLDHELVELCAQLDIKHKLKGYNTKHFLKEIIQGIVPDQIIHRKKMGFGIPVNEWFRGELKDYLQDIIMGNNSFVCSIFKKDKLEDYFKSHLEKERNLGNNFWNLLTLELWFKIYF